MSLSGINYNYNDELHSAVHSYLTTPSPEALAALFHKIQLAPQTFFLQRDKFARTFFEKMVVDPCLSPLQQLRKKMEFLAQLWQTGLHPLVITYSEDKTALRLCLEILNNASNAKLLMVDDYILLFTSAIIELQSEEHYSIDHLLTLLISIKIDDMRPLSCIINYFPPQLLQLVFDTLNHAYLIINSLSKTNYYYLLTARDRLGLLPLHSAIKNKNELAISLLYDAMTLLFTREEHLEYHSDKQKINFLDWIAFHGNIHFLKEYVDFLIRNLEVENTYDLLLRQAKNPRRVRAEFDKQSPMMECLVILGTPFTYPHLQHSFFNRKIAGIKTSPENAPLFNCKLFDVKTILNEKAQDTSQMDMKEFPTALLNP